MGKQKVKKIENYTLTRRKLSELVPAEYNPRKMEPDARRRLETWLKKAGLLHPSFVFNKRTGRLVGGHQRLDILGKLYGDIEVDVSIVDLSEKQEAEANLKLNNNEKLFEMSTSFELDMKDMGFSDIDLDFMFDGIRPEKKEEKAVYSEYQQANMAKLKETKKAYKERIEQENKQGKTIYTKEDDYTLTVVFADNSEKARFMKMAHLPKSEKYIQGAIIFDMIGRKE